MVEVLTSQIDVFCQSLYESASMIGEYASGPPNRFVVFQGLVDDLFSSFHLALSHRRLGAAWSVTAFTVHQRSDPFFGKTRTRSSTIQ